MVHDAHNTPHNARGGSLQTAEAAVRLAERREHSTLGEVGDVEQNARPIVDVAAQHDRLVFHLDETQLLVEDPVAEPGQVHVSVFLHRVVPGSFRHARQKT
jgi:hypothetical protein